MVIWHRVIVKGTLQEKGGVGVGVGVSVCRVVGLSKKYSKISHKEKDNTDTHPSFHI